MTARASASASARGQRENLTVRQLAQIAGSHGGLAFIGSPGTVADEMEEWLFEEGSDGFNIMFPCVPDGIDDLSTWWFRNCSAAACSEPNTRARRCRKIWDCQGPNQFFSSSKERSAVAPVAHENG